MWLQLETVVGRKLTAAVFLYPPFTKGESMALIPTRNQTRLQIIGLVVFLVLVGWYAIVGSQRGVQWDGEGTVNVFLESDTTKNYRLDAMMDVTTIKKSLLSNQQEYNVTSITLPNGESQYFEGDCKTNQSSNRVLCKTESGDSYYVEVEKVPSKS